MNFHFISVSPTKKQTYDQKTLKNIKGIQEEEIRTWRGLNIKFTMRPGNTLQEGPMSHSSSTSVNNITPMNGTVRRKTSQASTPQEQSNSSKFLEETKLFQKIEE
jgi:hypothetical protein